MTVVLSLNVTSNEPINRTHKFNLALNKGWFME